MFPPELSNPNSPESQGIETGTFRVQNYLLRMDLPHFRHLFPLLPYKWACYNQLPTASAPSPKDHGNCSKGTPMGW